ncbi:MAG: type III-B CRISPR module-associated protein Cmr3 [Zoogloea sp.]|nr:type III-B CRISPR module-associated protein Cmr3 [Zoogloea sp.]
MSIETRFIEPLDVLFLRGNKLFGDPGSHGESLVPPWPSVAAGALRSRMLADERVDLAAFARGDVDHPSLGTPKRPGSFAVTAFHLARRFADGRVELLIAPPADLVIAESEDEPSVRRLQPTALASGLLASGNLPLLPVLAEVQRGKPAGGYWLTQTGWQKYLEGETPAAADLLKSSQLWAIDHRVGVGLDAHTRRAADGKLFSMQAVSMVQHQHSAAGFDVGFVAAVSGAELPKDGSLRLGGDGRAAALQPCNASLPTADHAAIAAARRCRIVLSTPGIFADGWRLSGVDTQGRFALGGVRGKLVCAAVPRFEAISGWDLARREPKPAQRVAPTGSVYWLDELDATPEALRKLVATGLWSEPCEDAHRRAEGFNRFSLANW